MNIAKIFSTKARVKILDSILYLENEFGVNETAKKLNLSKGLVSKYFEILRKEGILKKSKGKFHVQNNSLVKSLKIMFNLQKIDTKIFKRYKFVKGVGLYGSCAKGTNTESSDVDLWVKVKEGKMDNIVELMTELRSKIKNVKVLVLDDEKIASLKKKDPLFYYSLYFGSIVIYGEESEI